MAPVNKSLRRPRNLQMKRRKEPLVPKVKRLLVARKNTNWATSYNLLTDPPLGFFTAATGFFLNSFVVAAVRVPEKNGGSLTLSSFLSSARAREKEPLARPSVRKTMRLAPSNRHAIPKWGANHWSSSPRARKEENIKLLPGRGRERTVIHSQD